MFPVRPFSLTLAALATVAGVSLAGWSVRTPAPAPPPVLAVVDHGPVSEMSGLVASRRFPGVFWTHNDSGDSARIFAIDKSGNVLMPPFLASSFRIGPEGGSDKRPLWPGLRVDGATNYDWEDIATDGDSLYIADMGNNGNARRDLAVYQLAEPNPKAVESAHVLRRIPVAYPDQKGFPDPENWQFDCEAVFLYQGKLHFLTKHRAPGKIGIPQNGTKLYRLDSERTDRVNILTQLDSLADLGGWITGADVSPDGKTLAVLCHAPISSVWLFELPRSGGRLLQGPVKRMLLSGTGQCEAIAFDTDSAILVTNEQRQVFRLDVGGFQPARAGRR